MALLLSLSLLLAGVPLTGLDYFRRFYGRSGVCLALHLTPQRAAGWHYAVVVFVFINLISFSVIAVAYSWMFVAVIRSRSQSRSHEVSAVTCDKYAHLTKAHGGDACICTCSCPDTHVRH